MNRDSTFYAIEHFPYIRCNSKEPYLMILYQPSVWAPAKFHLKQEQQESLKRRGGHRCCSKRQPWLQYYGNQPENAKTAHLTSALHQLEANHTTTNWRRKPHPTKIFSFIFFIFNIQQVKKNKFMGLIQEIFWNLCTHCYPLEVDLTKNKILCNKFNVLFVGCDPSLAATLESLDTKLKLDRRSRVIYRLKIAG